MWIKAICENNKGVEHKLEKGQYYDIAPSSFHSGQVQVKQLSVSPQTNEHQAAFEYRFRKLDDSFATSVLEKVTEQIKEEELEEVYDRFWEDLLNA